MLIGYARSSLDNDTIESQKALLKSAGCQRIYKERTDNSRSPRLVLNGVLEFLNEGDTLVVCGLDRLARSVKELVTLVAELQKRNIAFQSLKEAIDTRSEEGQVILKMFCALAEFEHSVIQERTQTGLRAARSQGRLGGRPTKLTPMIIKQAKILYEEGQLPQEICQKLGIGRTSFFKAVTMKGAS